MSASREKKVRQDLASQGYIDPKTEREAKAKAEAKRNKIVYGVIAIVFVLVAAVLLVYNSGVLERNSTALTIDGEKFTPAQVDYFYYNAYNNVANSSYASYYGISSSAPLSSQKMNDMAKLMLGIDSEEDLTWDAYLKQTAQENLKSVYLVSKAAEADGMTVSDEIKAEVDSTMDALTSNAKTSGYSAKAYAKMIFGNNMTLPVLREMMEMSELAAHYQESYIDSLTYTDADLESAYQESPDTYDVADYESIYFAGTAATKDADGNTVTPTDLETAAAAEAAKTNAAAAAERYAAGETLEAIADSYDNATYSHTTNGQYAGTDLSDWLFDEARVDGESTTITTDPNVQFVVFHSCGRYEYNTINVRHCLISVDSSALDSTSATYGDELAALKETAKAEAEALLAEWKSGEATEASFGAMADEHSDDSPEGGLYKQVYKNQMVTAFNDWCFDESRKTGDTDIVETDYGYHIMYFVGTDAPYWQVQAKNVLANADASAWLESLTADVEMVEGSGMEYVG